MKTILSIIIIILFASLLTSTQAFSQKSSRLTKNEKILRLAYNDTTKALALLFVERRNVTRSQSANALIGIGISSGVFLVGAAIMASNPDSGIVIASGLTPVLLGTGGVILFSSVWIISKLRKNPYTLRKFEKLIAMSMEGKPIPEFYLHRIEKNHFL